MLEKGPLGFPIPSTWWLIPLSKWVITPVINGISRVNPLITGVITHLLSGMSHQVGMMKKQLAMQCLCTATIRAQWCSAAIVIVAVKTFIEIIELVR